MNGLEKKRMRQLRKALNRGRYVQIEKKLRAAESLAAKLPTIPTRDFSLVVFDTIDRVHAMRPEYVRRCRVDLGNRQFKIDRAEREARRLADRAEERKAAKEAEREAKRIAAKKAAALEKRRATLAAKAAGGTQSTPRKTGRGA